ncbi:MAG: WD40 repeat domain-containing protein [Abitibacteriaceae bacterium]|nr:WD40 repeat domain-containing protein [Abditibacteriaceae bacterium]
MSQHIGVQLLDAQTLQSLHPLYSPEKGWPLALSPDFKLVASAYDEGDVYSHDGLYSYEARACIVLNDAITGKLLRTRTQSCGLSAIAFSPQGNLLASGADSCGPGMVGGSTGEWTLWRVQSHDLRGPLLSNGDQVSCIAFAPDGKSVVAGVYEGVLKLWNTQSGQLLKTLDVATRRRPFSEIYAVTFAPNGKIIASGYDNNQIWLWDVATGKPVQVCTGHTKAVVAIAFAPDSKVVASGSADGTIKLWDVFSGQVIRTLRAPHGVVHSIAFAPNGQTLASGYGDGTVALWRIK